MTITFVLGKTTFRRNEEKNAILKQQRGVSFEEIELCIRNGFLLDIIQHPQLDHQYIFIVKQGTIIYKVPFVIESGDIYFLKTIYPHSASKRIYY